MPTPRILAKRQARRACRNFRHAPLVPRLLIVTPLVLALFAPAPLFARGGLRWGYYNEVQGNPFVNLWLLTSPWAAMSGWGIPHHNLNPNGLPTQPDPNAAPRSPYGNTWRTQPFDRNAVFIGSASQPSSYVPPVRASYASASTMAAPLPTGPYRVDKSLDPAYYQNYNSYWRHGYWGGGLRGWAQWGKALGERAFPRWSVGPLYYLSGYGVYRNPFLSNGAAPSGSAFDYRQPLIDVDADEPLPRRSSQGDDSADDRARTAAEEARRYQEAREYLVKTPQLSAALKALDAGREAFRNKDYDQALKKTDEALEHVPRDPAFHEFRALVLFARGEYRAAAAAIYAVLAVSPGWDWTTLSSMYADSDELTIHLRQLETYRKQHTDAADASFLLAYHYTTFRHPASAVKQLRNVAKLLPDDNLIPPLLALIAGADDKAAAAAAQGSESPATVADANLPAPGALSAIDPEQLTGEWKASRGGAVVVELALTDEGESTWVVRGGPAVRRFEGYYATDGERLILVSPRGPLPGKLIPRIGGGFRFSLAENDPADPGLEFVK
jgi:tetratricopeptide (TPR) repeat protein